MFDIGYLITIKFIGLIILLLSNIMREINGDHQLILAKLVRIGFSDKSRTVAARYCEGGHLCSPPKECCAQGCCYLYAPPTVPRTTPPPSDHVLNLFFINHWYFWCVVLALILALLCACSLWKRRRQLCNWDINLPSSQSEGDSAGSCYAPPQYSRCSSFHHAPPPYTEVTSKPDLYPIVFTCNGDGIKNGASYLMVQYFRNYIVRPAGSLSAASTVDSLSSSFICTVNDSNTLVPPPYSRAASPEPEANDTVDGCSIPRSASHQICFTDMNCFQFNSSPFATATLNNNNSNSRNSINNNNSSSRNKNRNSMRMSESVNFSNINNTNCIFNNSNSVILSRSDQEFRYNIINTNNNNSNSSNNINNSQPNNNSTTIPNLVKTNNNNSSSSTNNSSHNVTNNNNTNNNSTKFNNNSNNNINNNQIECTTNGLNKNLSFNSIGCVSLNQPITSSSSGMGNHHHRNCGTDIGGINDQNDNQTHQHHHHHHHHNNHTTIPSASFNSEDSPINTDYVKKFECIRSLVNSNTGSAVSSLANIDSPSSPPRATSPTAEVKELLEQINKLQINNVVDFDTIENIESINSLSSCSNNMNINTNSHNSNSNYNTNSNQSSSSIIKLKRPSTLQTKKKFFSKTNKGLYTPIQNESSKSKNFVGSNSILGTGRGRRSWISRSAPTTPGSALPSNRIGDNSPLLNEHDEDNEQNV